jgi:hypothetical protein
MQNRESQAGMSASPNFHRVLIAWSRLEIGLPPSSAENQAQNLAQAGGEVRSLQSGFEANSREFGRIPQSWERIWREFSTAQTAWRREWDSIRPEHRSFSRINDLAIKLIPFSIFQD